jgi:predicted Fe-S protein YdhL (DUF1289 family)
MNTCGIVITSIFDNGWLERVTKEIEHSGEKDNVTIIYIVDYKTPPLIFEKIKNFTNAGFKIIAPKIEEQFQLEKKLGIDNFILINSDHRRNLGYLIAYEKGFDFVISMDDDNFPITKNFINEHRTRLGSQKNKTEINSKSGAFNNCLLLDESTFLHPRGYPFNRRMDNSIMNAKDIESVNVGVNAGMWLIAPDVDAISWLICNKKFEGKIEVKDLVLHKDTYCPVNSQNTSLLREFIPAYYFIRMGYDIGGGLKFDRLGDIYSGYFLQKVVKERSSAVSFGMPLVTHERNSHNYLNDANNEWGCLRTIDEFFDWISLVKLSGNNVLEIYKNLIDELNQFASRTNFKYMNTSTKGFYHAMANDMNIWLNLVKNI